MSSLISPVRNRVRRFVERASLLGDSWWCRLRQATEEPALSGFYDAYVASGRSTHGYVLRHPVATLVAAAAASRLPEQETALSPSIDGRVIEAALVCPG